MPILADSGFLDEAAAYTAVYCGLDPSGQPLWVRVRHMTPQEHVGLEAAAFESDARAGIAVLRANPPDNLSEIQREYLEKVDDDTLLALARSGNPGAASSDADLDVRLACACAVAVGRSEDGPWEDFCLVRTLDEQGPDALWYGHLGPAVQALAEAAKGSWRAAEARVSAAFPGSSDAPVG
jgi:hypothetical protein